MPVFETRFQRQTGRFIARGFLMLSAVCLNQQLWVPAAVAGIVSYVWWLCSEDDLHADDEDDLHA